MTKYDSLQLFEKKKVRTIWDDEQEKWYFAIVDVVAVLTEQNDYQISRNYWKVLKNRLKNEGNETVTNCNRFKLQAADGKMRITDVADTEQLFRLVQSIPSPKAISTLHLQTSSPKNGADSRRKNTNSSKA